KTVWTEVIRLKKYGVTGNELTRAKNEYLKRKESGYNERSKTRSGSYVNKYMNHFLKGEAPLDIEFEYPMSKELTSEITTKDISASIAKYISNTNRDILVTAPEKDKDALPKEADFNRWMKEVESSKIAANQDNKNNKTLLATKPATGKIVNTTTNSAIGTTEFTLSNGVKVVLKPTDFKNDEISFTAFSPGGTSLYKDNEYESADAATGVTTSAGLGDFTLSELQKHLTGKRMNVKPYIGERYEGFSGSAAPDDLETALQLVYLYFTQPRKDFSVITGELERAKVSIANRGNDPSTVFSDSVSAILSNYNIRRTAPSIEKLNAIDFNRSYDIYKERFADAGDFTFTFVGNFDVEKIKPLLEQYLGALPAINRVEEARNLGIQTPAGKIDRKVYKGIDNKSSVRLVFSGSYNYSETENYKLNALADLLTIKLIERLREDEGGVYGVSASANYSKFPKNRYSVNISFGCAPTNVEKLISAVQEVIEKVKTELPQALDIEKIVNEDLRSMELQLKTNGFWLSYLVGKQQTGDNLLSVLDYKEKLKKITPEALQSAAREYLTGENFIRIVLYPEKKQ
ncbi:MAG TPA: insulinase family protein, partial [Paludibacter sp.]|nr:insulinase family protein [Paludibacter sp.]